MMTTALSNIADPELIQRSRAGDREAFGELVTRHQSLICSIAYSATGNLTQSEDLAQETFLAAWRQLGHLREPHKFSGWLCGITRNLTANLLRKEGRARTEPMEALSELSSPEPLPPERAVTREEEALLWRSIERIPETYREPLVLFYRENQSVASVARALELTEDAVKQRLSRGRKLLQDEMSGFVESTLARSAPGRAFTLGVLAALPAFTLSASAATAGATAVKGSAAATSSLIVTALGAVVGPIVGLAGAYIGAKASLDSTRTPREREFMKRQIKAVAIVTLLFNVAIAIFVFLAVKGLRTSPFLFAGAGAAIMIGFAIFITIQSIRLSRKFAALRDEEIAANPGAFSQQEITGAVREYRSKAALFGLPLLHMRAGRRRGEKLRPAMGWIAIGDQACGLIACGGLAVGGVALGGASVGVFAFGGASLGLLSIGGLAVGIFALGGGAVGVIASGGFALGLKAAIGGLAAAREYAMGGAAYGAHANDEIARQFFRTYEWMNLNRPWVRNATTTLSWLPLLLFLPFLRKLRKR